jgi:chromosome segregation ATPase
MNDQPQSMNRSLFGVRRSAVHQMISDRDVMLRQAEGRVRAAESKVARLESEAAALQEANARLQQDLGALRSGADQGSSDVTSRFVNEELGTILAAAEESATRIVERARASTQQQVAEAERVWREAQAQVSQFAAWRDQVDPVLRAAQAKIDDVRARIEEVPDQIRDALAPLAESVASLDGDLAEVTGADTPPVLSNPADQESEDETAVEATEGLAPVEDLEGEDVLAPEGTAEAGGEPVDLTEGAGAEDVPQPAAVER